MKKILLLLTILMGSIISLSAQTNTEALKNQVIERIDHHSQDLISLSDAIWEFAEIAFKENQSAKALSDYAEDNGFTVTRGVGEIPTAFTAEFSRGEGPIIGIMGEFDALPGLSQETVPHKSPLIENAPGHGCGHNILVWHRLGRQLQLKS